MNVLIPVLIGGAALLALGAAGGGGTQSSVNPQRTPSVPPGKPPSPQGEQRNNDEGRTWGTFYANRNEVKHWELPVLSVAASPGNDAIGTGEVIADVYETIVAPADWQWHGQVCEGRRWRLRFVAGHLVDPVTIVGPRPCSTLRPMYEVLAQQFRWVQVGAIVLLVVDTQSGVNMLSPDKLLKSATHKPGRFGGTGKFYDASSSSPQWNNDYVASSNVTLDAAWIFNPA